MQLAIGEVGSWEKEGHVAFVILPLATYIVSASHLRSDEQVPPLDEMPTKVSGWWADNLYTDVVPSHSRPLTSLVDNINVPGHPRDF